MRCPKYALATNGSAVVTCKYECNSVFGKCARDFCLERGEVLEAEGLLEKRGNCVRVKRGKGRGLVRLKLPVGSYVIGNNLIKVLKGEPVNYVEDDDSLYVRTEGGLVKIKMASLSGVLEEAWALKLDGRVKCVATDEDLAASAECAYIVREGRVVERKCWNWVPLGCDAHKRAYAFASDYMVMIFRGGQWEEFYVGHDYGNSVVLLGNSFVACWDKCALFEGEERVWELTVGRVRGRPSSSDGLLYIPDYAGKRLLVVDVDRGSLVEEMKYGGGANWSYARNGYVAVAADDGLYLYSGLKLIWRIAGRFNAVAISPKARFLAASSGRNLYVFDIEGWELNKISFSSTVTSLDWGERLVAGLSRGEVVSLSFPIRMESLAAIPLEEIL
ncbi:MAG: hypothetical protein GXO07_01190 [Crenarchaeota archaeon]|nr:hypothetical protein [Thermoproteota archaeon]